MKLSVGSEEEKVWTSSAFVSFITIFILKFYFSKVSNLERANSFAKLPLPSL